MKIPFFGRKQAPAPARAPRSKRSLLRAVVSGMFKSAKANANDAWDSIPIPPDQYISQRQPTLVARSREQWSNNDHVRSFVRLIKQNIVGPQGVQLQAKSRKARGALDSEANAAIESAWRAWGKKENCDISERLTWRGMQALAAETAGRDGEFIIRMLTGANAGEWGFSLQFIDPQRLPVNYNVDYYGKGATFIRNGIEFTHTGKPVAYHFTSTDDNDRTYYSMSGRGFVIVPAEEIVHGFVTEMATQRRGLPWASTSLERLHHLEGFETAAVQNARAGAAKMGFIEYESGFGPDTDGEPVTVDAEPLGFVELPEGAHLAKFDPQYPSGEFAVFHKAMLRGAAAGMGVLYNNLAGDLEGVNFSSIRQGTLDEREHWKDCQQWLIEDLVEPVYNAWLRWSLLAGKITKANGAALPADRLAAFREVQWQPRRWEWIDPRADADSAISSIRAGLTSPGAVIRERGRDPETVYREIAQDLEQMKSAGIPAEIIKVFITGETKPPPPPAAAAAEKTKETA